MTISIRNIIHEYAATLERKWKHDRSQTVGASEIGACIRKTWFSKYNTLRDPDYQDSWGARVRGTVIEEKFWVPALRAKLPEDVQLLFAYPEQHTLTSGYVSATTDGLLVWPNGYCINLDCKTEDPRNNRHGAKTEHVFQTQTQMGLFRETTEHRPDESIVTYIDASFWDQIDEPRVAFDPRIYAAAHARAEKIMTTRDALAMEPEGRISGGSECRWCPWQSHCAEVTVAGVPKAISILSDGDLVALREMRDDLIRYRARQEEVETQVAKKQENIKQFMKERNTRSYRGDDWSVNYSTSSGKKSLDWQAVEEAGIDLSPFQKEGRGFERLVVK